MSSKRKVKPKRSFKMSKNNKGAEVNNTSGQLTKASSEKGLVNPAEMAEWGTQALSAKDVLIPRLLLMQGMSPMVTKGDGKIGEIRESLNESLLAAPEKSFEIIPFKMDRIWKEMELDKKTVKQIIPVVDDATSPDYNDDLPNDVRDAKENLIGHRFRALRFFALLPHISPLPHMVEFKSTSLRAGKKLATQMYTTNRMLGKSPAATVFKLTGRKEEKDKQVFALFDVAVSRESSAEEVAEALSWFKMLSSGKGKVHEEGDDTVV
jgi:hypothetical protein